jgi:phosphoenolpyruvate carboxykinase (GTP)
MGTRSDEAPPIFQVNWFRTDEAGRFLWPGFGENLRVLRWILGRSRGEAPAVRTPIGYVPPPGGIDVAGLDLPPGRMERLLSVDREAWRAELEDQERFFQRFGARLPREMWDEHERLRRRLEAPEAA